MKTLMLFGAAFGLLGLMATSPALGGEAGIVKEMISGVSYMTGGVSEGERAEMEAMSGKYNLKVVLATQEGSYLSRLPVSIRDARGNDVLEARTSGPWLFARLPHGSYTVRATYNGVERNRTIRVDDGLKVVMVHWNAR